MYGSLQYMLVQKIAEAEHKQRVADALARAAHYNGESAVRVQLRRILGMVNLNWKAFNTRPDPNPCAQLADSSQPC